MRFLAAVVAVLIIAGAACTPSERAQQARVADRTQHVNPMHRWIDQTARSPVKPASGEFLDLNKNGKKDPYEDPNVPIERRIDDLIAQMNLDEKSCQLATLYGYQRVLTDALPTPQWKNKIWKDGIA